MSMTHVHIREKNGRWHLSLSEQGMTALVSMVRLELGGSNWSELYNINPTPEDQGIKEAGEELGNKLQEVW